MLWKQFFKEYGAHIIRLGLGILCISMTIILFLSALGHGRLMGISSFPFLSPMSMLVLAGALLMIGGTLCSIELSHFAAALFANFFYPTKAPYAEDTPNLGIAATLMNRGEYTEAATELESLLDDYPNAMEIYQRLLKLRIIHEAGTMTEEEILHKAKENLPESAFSEINSYVEFFHAEKERRQSEGIRRKILQINEEE
ncbi:MAG: tetratricopeptide repeat protein [Lentisphaerae bacterium]|nr:MAG: tetratricopeptide repeat protein [Lentisphaerota bacterium]